MKPSRAFQALFDITNDLVNDIANHIDDDVSTAEDESDPNRPISDSVWNIGRGKRTQYETQDVLFMKLTVLDMVSDGSLQRIFFSGMFNNRPPYHKNSTCTLEIYT